MGCKLTSEPTQRIRFHWVGGNLRLMVPQVLQLCVQCSEPERDGAARCAAPPCRLNLVVIQPNLHIYRPGTVMLPTSDQLILLTGNCFHPLSLAS